MVWRFDLPRTKMLPKRTFTKMQKFICLYLSFLGLCVGCFLSSWCPFFEQKSERQDKTLFWNSGLSVSFYFTRSIEKSWEGSQNHKLEWQTQPRPINPSQFGRRAFSSIIRHLSIFTFHAFECFCKTIHWIASTRYFMLNVEDKLKNCGHIFIKIWLKKLKM